MTTNQRTRTVEIDEGDGTTTTVEVPVVESAPEPDVAAEVSGDAGTNQPRLVEEVSSTTEAAPPPVEPAVPIRGVTPGTIVEVDEGTGEPSQIEIGAQPPIDESRELTPGGDTRVTVPDAVLERQLREVAEREAEILRESEQFQRSQEIRDFEAEQEAAIQRLAEAASQPLVGEGPLLPGQVRAVDERVKLSGPPREISIDDHLAVLRLSEQGADAAEIRRVVAQLTGVVPEGPTPRAVVEAAEKVGISDRAAEALLATPSYLLSPAQQQVREDLNNSLSLSRNRSLPFTQVVGDNLREALTFGQVETETFNQQDIERKWDEAEAQLSRDFDEAVAAARAEGKVVQETKTEWIRSVLPGKEEYVRTVVEAQPQLAELAKEFGEASIPIYGTAKTWEDSPNWARAVGVAADVAFFVPILGQAAAASRAGASFTGTAARLGIAELTAPLTAVRRPFATLKSALEPVETVLDPRKVPVEALEVRRQTIRFPVEPGRTAHPGVIDAPDDLFRGVPKEEIQAEAFRAREELTRAGVEGRGFRTSAEFLGGEFDVPQPALQRLTGAAAVSSSPDIRNFLTGTTLGAGGTGGDPRLFLAPGRMERFVQRTSSGRPVQLSPEAARAVELKNIPDKPIKGSVIIRDEELLEKLEDSGQIYQGTAEIETTLPSGTHIPRPSQMLFTRSAETGERTAIAVIGKPFSPFEIAKLKLIAPAEQLRSIFRPGPGRFQSGISSGIDQTRSFATRADDLFQQAEKAEAAGDFVQAAELRRAASNFLSRAEEAYAGANVRAFSAQSMVSAQYYTGDEDITGALQTLSEPVAARPEVPTRVPGSARPLDVALRQDDLSIPTRAPQEPQTQVSRVAVGPAEPESRGFIGEPDDLSGRVQEPLARQDLTPEVARVTTPTDETPTRPETPEGERPAVPEAERPVVPTGERPVVPPTGETPPRPEVPTGRPAVPPEARVTPGRPRIRGDQEMTKMQTRQPRRRGALTWKQGEVWVIISEPYGEDEISYARNRPAGVTVVRGARDAWQRILNFGFEPEVETYDEWAAWFNNPDGHPETQGMTMPKGRERKVKDPTNLFNNGVDRFFNVNGAL